MSANTMWKVPQTLRKGQILFLRSRLDIERLEEFFPDQNYFFRKTVVADFLAGHKRFHAEALPVIKRYPDLRKLIYDLPPMTSNLLLEQLDSMKRKKPDIQRNDYFAPPATEENKNFFDLKHYGFEYGKNVFFISTEDEILRYDIKNKIASEGMVALDTESHPMTNGLALFQVATPKEIYLFSFETLQISKVFNEMMQWMLTSPEILLIGQDLLYEIKTLLKHFSCTKACKVLDVKFLFNQMFCHERKCSLKFLTERFLNLSKVEQMSNWCQRPLRLSQLHYAASDAYIQFLIVQKIQQYFGTDFLQMETMWRDVSL